MGDRANGRNSAKLWLEGSRLGAQLKDLALFYPERGRPSRVLNRRLPGITARDVLPTVRFADCSFACGPTQLTPVETFAGAAVDELCGHLHAETNITGLFGTIQSGSPPVKALRASIRRFALSPFRLFAVSAFSSLPHRDRAAVAVQAPDQQSLGVIEQEVQCSA